MSESLKHLNGMLSGTDSFKHSFLSRPVSCCSKLLSVVDVLRQRAENKPPPKPPLDPEKVWKLWESRQFDPLILNSVQVRTLCVSEKTALRKEWLRHLKSEIEVLQRSSCLLGLTLAYVTQWRKTSTAGDAEEVLRRAFGVYHGKNPQVRKLAAEAPLLFSPTAAAYLASEAVRGSNSPAEPLVRRGLSPSTGLGEAVSDAAIGEWIKYFEDKQSKANEEEVCRQAEYATKRLLRAETPPLSFYKVIRTLILSHWGDRSDHFRKHLQAYVTSHKSIGDPRLLKNGANWAALGQDATRRFLGWLARDSIIFFFNYILPDTHENRRRKDFWLEYHMSIRDFQVAVCEAQSYRLRLSKDLQNMPAYARVKHQNVSAFIMVFESGAEEYVVVEFSETGNAAYIYGKQAFIKAAGGIRNPEFELTRLKDKSRLERILHTGEWEWRARQTLSYLGVRPPSVAPRRY